MNSDYPCDVIRDLLPGYIDGILSQAGENAVRVHLEKCSECRLSHAAMSEKLREEPDASILPKEQAALDGFKKVRRLTKKLKLAAWTVTGILVLCVAAVFMKVYVIGSPISTGPVELTDYSYDEETGALALEGVLHLVDYRVSRVVCRESDEEDHVINVFVYVAETLPFLPGGQEQPHFRATIPDAKGYVVYHAGAGYDRAELYNWKHDHYEKLAEMEEEIYTRIPALDRDEDALIYFRGTETVNGTEGIRYSVDTMIGEDAYYWWFNDQLVMHGDFGTLDLDIWISLEEPYQILVFDYRTGQYTEDFSVVADRKSAVAVGAMNFVNPHATAEVAEGIEAYMRRYGVGDVTELIGAVSE